MAEVAVRLPDSDDEANVYPEDSSSDDEDLHILLERPYDSDNSPPDSDDKDEYTYSLGCPGPSAPTSDHPPPILSHGTPRTKRPSSAQASNHLPQEQTAPSAPTSPHHVPISSASDSDSTESKKRRKREATHRGESVSTALSEEEEGEERWHNKGEKDTRPNKFNFTPARTPGPTFDTTASWTPLSLFRLFFSDSTVQTIISNTNANAVKKQRTSAESRWTPLADSEFWIFVTIILFMSLVSLPNRSEYWRKESPFGFPFPRSHMSRKRFEDILWSLHLSNPSEDEENDKKRSTAEYDRLFKIKPLYTEIVSACQANFQPYQNISINERMLISNARVIIKQRMRNEPINWGYKLFFLVDAQTAYMFNFFVYQGKSESTTGQSMRFSSVWDLLPFQTLGQGYNLYLDNLYTSPLLFEELFKRRIGCCGTIRKTRCGYPKTEVSDLSEEADRGDMRWIRRGQLLFVKWKDTREVNMCSTIHEAFTGQTAKVRVKEDGKGKIKAVPIPDAVADYSAVMSAADFLDTRIKYYSDRQRTMKWYKTFFYHFIDIAVVNSFLLHKEVCKRKKQKPHSQKIFRDKLCKEMLDLANAPLSSPPVTCMPVFFRPEDIAGGDKYCKRCADAGDECVKTHVYCRKCQVPLCLAIERNCYADWHTAMC